MDLVASAMARNYRIYLFQQITLRQPMFAAASGMDEAVTLLWHLGPTSRGADAFYSCMPRTNTAVLQQYTHRFTDLLRVAAFHTYCMADQRSVGLMKDPGQPS